MFPARPRPVRQPADLNTLKTWRFFPAIQPGKPMASVQGVKVEIHVVCAGSTLYSRLIDSPIFTGQSLNTHELACVTRDQRQVACLGLSCNQDIVRPDGCAL